MTPSARTITIDGRRVTGTPANVGYVYVLIIQSLGTLNAAAMMVALVALGIVMALGIKQVEMRLLRWRPEYRKQA